jgi:D-psicose/D-tagatose/L-ribulose 3-epimerase
MKLSISNIAWDKEDNDTVADLMKKYGLSGVELAPGKIFDNPSEASTEEIVSQSKYWSSQGIKVSAIQAFLFGHPELTIFESPEIRTQTLGYIKRMIDFAGDLGAPILIFGSPKNRRIEGMDHEEALSIAKDFFSELGEKARSRDCYFCLEPNPEEYGADFMLDTAETLAVIHEVSHPNVSLNLDSGIMTMNKESYAQSIQKGKDYLKHFHVSEPQLMPLGGGLVDHSEIASDLNNIGYNHWVSVEMRQPSENVLESIESSLKIAKEVYGDE